MGLHKFPRDFQRVSTPREFPEVKFLYRCPLCGWYRYVPSDPDKQQREIQHLVYGKISIIELARTEARRHSCKHYMNSLERIRKWRTHVGKLSAN
jgi:hypothetical protein